MSRFDRQQRIRGWDQARLAAASVSVHGRGWPGTFLVWALQSLGLATINWLGRPQPATQTMANWLLGTAASSSDTCINEFPFDAEYDSTLEWSVPVRDDIAQVFVECSDMPTCREVCRGFVARHPAVRWLAGGAAAGGWLTVADDMTPPHEATASENQIAAMVVAALSADIIRSWLCPLPTDLSSTGGYLGWSTTDSPPAGTAVLVGVGGIGCYAAPLLAARGHGLLVVDSDFVEDSNRNRQGLFAASDAVDRTPKALAAVRALSVLFPHSRIQACVRRVDASFRPTLEEMQVEPDAILSAVDNARTRLVLQDLGQDLAVPTIQAGTDVFGADCFAQLPCGPLLDAQMHGALSDAAAAEGQATGRGGGCIVDPSYVVPGMIAGAMLAYRFEQLRSGGESLDHELPIRWRQGGLPIACGSLSDEHNLETVDLGGFVSEAS